MPTMLHLLHEHLFSILPFIVFIFFIIKWLCTTSKNLPPSPPKLPILGHLHRLGTSPHRALLGLSKKYGDIMLLYLGSTPTIIISSASVAKEIFKTHDAVLSNRPKSIISDKLLYNSRDVAAAPYGEYWRQMKSLFVLQLLSNRRVRSFRVIREEETALLIENISNKSGEAVNLSQMVSTLTNDVICRVAFGMKFTGKDGGVDFKKLLDEFMELLGVFSVGGFIPWLGWVDRLSGLDEKLDKVARTFNVLLEQILQEHSDRLNRRNNSNEDTNGKEAKDLVDVLLEIQRENSVGFQLEKDSIKALILDAFSAGTHTTSTVLEWAMTELLRHPKVMKELQKEVTEITGGKEEITEEDLEKMKYLKAVIKETLRLHPPIPLVPPRESTQELTLNGYHLPAKTTVIINAWAIHRDPRTWRNPEEFYPERFLESAIDYKGQDFELLPFGSGRRICPGISFAIANNELVLANLMHKFDWKLPASVTGETLDMTESSGLTAHRKTPLLAVASPRKHSK